MICTRNPAHILHNFLGTKRIVKFESIMLLVALILLISLLSVLKTIYPCNLGRFASKLTPIPLRPLCMGRIPHVIKNVILCVLSNFFCGVLVYICFLSASVNFGTLQTSRSKRNTALPLKL